MCVFMFFFNLFVCVSVYMFLFCISRSHSIIRMTKYQLKRASLLLRYCTSCNNYLAFFIFFLFKFFHFFVCLLICLKSFFILYIFCCWWLHSSFSLSLPSIPKAWKVWLYNKFGKATFRLKQIFQSLRTSQID